MKEYVYYVPEVNQILISKVKNLYGAINLRTYTELYRVVLTGEL